MKPLITLPSEVAKAINTGTIVPKPISPQVASACRRITQLNLLNAGIEPTFKNRLLVWSSFAALMYGKV
jgi:hypothetical protein